MSGSGRMIANTLAAGLAVNSEWFTPSADVAGPIFISYLSYSGVIDSWKRSVKKCQPFLTSNLNLYNKTKKLSRVTYDTMT